MLLRTKFREREGVPRIKLLLRLGYSYRVFEESSSIQNRLRALAKHIRLFLASPFTTAGKHRLKCVFILSPSPVMPSQMRERLLRNNFLSVGEVRSTHVQENLRPILCA